MGADRHSLVWAGWRAHRSRCSWRHTGTRHSFVGIEKIGGLPFGMRQSPVPFICRNSGRSDVQRSRNLRWPDGGHRRRPRRQGKRRQGGGRQGLYQVLTILTHRDVISDLSARSLIRSDAGHRKGRATRSESSEKTQGLSPLGRVGGRQQALEMSRIAPASTCGLLPTRRGPGAIPRGQYHQDLV